MASFWLWLPPLDPALHAILRGFVATAVAKQWWSHLARIFEIASFEVHGPFKIDYEKRRGGRTLVFDEFWSKDADASYLAKERGSYVFAVRNRGLTPIYVGNRTGSGVGKGVLSSPIECHGIAVQEGCSPTMERALESLVRFIEREEAARGRIARSERSRLAEDAEQCQVVLDKMMLILLGLGEGKHNYLRARLKEML